MNKTFELVPVSVKPEKDGWYDLIDPVGDLRAGSYYFKSGQWREDENYTGGGHFTVDDMFYLRPVPSATMMTLDEFATYFDKSPAFILRLKELYVYLGHGGIERGEWAEYNEKARRLVDSLMMRLLPNPQTNEDAKD